MSIYLYVHWIQVLLSIEDAFRFVSSFINFPPRYQNFTAIHEKQKGKEDHVAQSNLSVIIMISEEVLT